MIIAGPTATGKSKTAVELAKRIGGSVISVDSMQVYRGMDIGSAKVTREEMDGIPHYLIDIAEPEEDWNVVRFQSEAKKNVAEIYSQGRIPILTGGTGFYIQALLYDIDFTEMKTDSTYRDSLQNIADTAGPSALYEMLKEADPSAAEQIHPNNIKRIIRALEFHHESGTRISSHNEEQHKRPPAYNAAFFVLTLDRAKLYDRIDRRVDLMMEEGLLEEVKTLCRRGLTSSDVSMQGIGYKQILKYMEREGTELSPESLSQAVYEIKRDTRHFAKRQLTWFKREKDALFIDIDGFENFEAYIAHLEKIVRETLRTCAP